MACRDAITPKFTDLGLATKQVERADAIAHISHHCEFVPRLIAGGRAETMPNDFTSRSLSTHRKTPNNRPRNALAALLEI